ncbi:MAG: helix-turn-helix transcriptional regulator [bacterium]
MSRQPYTWDPTTNALAMALSGFMRHSRKQLSLSQEALADRVGCDRVTVPRIEQGRQLPSFQTLAQILRALDVRPALDGSPLPFTRLPDFRDRADLIEVVDVLSRVQPSTVATILDVLRAHHALVAANAERSGDPEIVFIRPKPTGFVTAR